MPEFTIDATTGKVTTHGPSAADLLNTTNVPVPPVSSRTVYPRQPAAEAIDPRVADFNRRFGPDPKPAADLKRDTPRFQPDTLVPAGGGAQPTPSPEPEAPVPAVTAASFAGVKELASRLEWRAVVLHGERRASCYLPFFAGVTLSWLRKELGACTRDWLTCYSPEMRADVHARETGIMVQLHRLERTLK